MPELPEVETIKRDLEKRLIGKKLLRIEIFQETFYKKYFKDDFLLKLKTLLSQKIKEIRRKGKYLLLLLENKVLVFHLGVTGALILGNPKGGNPLFNKKHLILTLEFDELSLFFIDIRKFGKVWILEKEKLEDHFFFLGKDALEISFKEFKDLLLSKNRLIKSFLLDQRIISGLGNIYTDEILFRSRINPLRKTKNLSEEEIKRIYQNMQEVLVKAIELRGSSVKNYINGKGERGAFQEEHLVYGKRGSPCPICGNPLQYKKIAQRGTTFCSRCQR
ncbi:MAG: DNA-formamidopyrimidine glycosylase [Thermodesulfobacteriaceae bacterium]|nr:DNA-formamidopyrimidine glycosylase [Thermodesulfobacteriaceae bacterium]MDW8135632.1 DNA-formamidopyrimidine glycosylase [Thermodesulfobacterium sp.]